MDSLFLDVDLSSSGTCRVSFSGTGKSIVVPYGTYLIDAAREAGLEVPQQCGRMAICSWCSMEVLEGESNLSELSDGERRLIDWEKLAETERASCQTEVLGNVRVTARYW